MKTNNEKQISVEELREKLINEMEETKNKNCMYMILYMSVIIAFIFIFAINKLIEYDYEHEIYFIKRYGGIIGECFWGLLFAVVLILAISYVVKYNHSKKEVNKLKHNPAIKPIPTITTPDNMVHEMVYLLPNKKYTMKNGIELKVTSCNDRGVKLTVSYRKPKKKTKS